MAAAVCQVAASCGAVHCGGGQHGSSRDLCLQTARELSTLSPGSLGRCFHLQQPLMRLNPSAQMSGSCGCAWCAGSRHCLDGDAPLMLRPAAPLLSPRSPVRMPAGTSLASEQLC